MYNNKKVTKTYHYHYIQWQTSKKTAQTLQWCHNGCDGVSNHQPHNCLLNRLFRRRSKKTSKLRVSGLCAGNSPVTSDFPAQRASNAENISSWCRHYVHLHNSAMNSDYLIMWLSFRIDWVKSAATFGLMSVTPHHLELPGSLEFPPFTWWILTWV